MPNGPGYPPQTYLRYSALSLSRIYSELLSFYSAIYGAIFVVNKHVMKKETREDIKIYSAILMLIASVGFGVAGFCVSPVGELSESVLWLIAQFLMYAAMALGVDAYVSLAVRKYLSKGGNNE